MAQGETIEEALKELQVATIEYLSSLLEDNIFIPSPVASTTSTMGYSPIEIVVEGTTEEDFIDTLSKTVQPLGRQHLGNVSIIH